ncbi:MAG: efflux RND transporter periplasmic adaptor subunit [Burkholderiales bacterium]|nr:efflux RND transporter periplasmic adaptor subunit [Burkholderiales bacterium]
MSIAGNASDPRPHLQVADAARLQAAAEDDAWGRFSGARSAEAFCAGWLAVTCIRADAVDGLLVLAGTDGQGFVPAAVWPDAKRDRAKLAELIEQCLESRAPATAPAGGDGNRFLAAQPVLVENELVGAVAMELAARDERGMLALSRELAWGAGWLEALLRRTVTTKDSTLAVRLRHVFDVFSAALEHAGFEPAATATVTELATLLDCDRASLAVIEGRRARVKALSHTVTFEKNAELTRAIEAAMDEATDQKSTLVIPAGPAGEGQVLKAHEHLVHAQGNAAVLTVPLTRLGDPVGALCLERATPYTPDDVDLVEGLAALLGEIQRAAERGPIARAWEVSAAFWKKLVGPGHAAWKLVALLLAAVTLFFSVATGTWRITATTKIEGAVMRAIAVPFEGYLYEAHVRAGDLVKQGAVLARLDDRDLQLERLKVAAKREQLTKQYREALANHDRAQIRVIGSQVEQADAELQITQEKLARTVLRAPFDGVVVSGDLSQQLGAPVQRGQVLFEIAPLEDWRVVLQVDERDVRDAAVGTPGELLLTAMPTERLPIHVARVTPVSTSEDGRNYFRVEAKMDRGAERLRPGMEGVGKIEVGERRLIWIWTRSLTDWLRLQLWSWLP